MTSLFLHPDSPANPASRFVRVVVERGIDRRAASGRAAADRSTADPGLTYSCPEPAPTVGERVEVPLGKSNAPAAGIVIRVGGRELLDGLDPDRVKPILRRTGTGLPRSLISLAEWMATYYVCPLGMVFTSIIPAAVKRLTGQKTVVELSLVPPVAGPDDPRLAVLTPRTRRLWPIVAAVEAAAFPMTARALGAVAEEVSPATIKRFIAAGLLTQRSRLAVQAERPVGLAASPSPAAPPILTAEQSTVVSGVGEALGSFSAHLLRGVTGSGKTEVYLRLIDRMFQEDARSSAIILVPEIALTPQTSRRFLDRFPGQVAVLHSGLSASQRHQQWAACAAGGVRLVVGARSAVFAPLPSVGLIVVDEEHDSSYKQDQLPRYHARDVAVKRAQVEGCPVVLGSATPSLESWANTLPSPDVAAPKYRLWTLTKRANAAPMPRVEIVDLLEQRRMRARLPGAGFDHHLHLLGPTLETALDRCLADGGQAILLLNRRGFANYICCTNAACGWALRCEHCDATSVYHLNANLPDTGYVRCHHCLEETKLPKTCPLSGHRINTFGLGTQRIEHELERKFSATRRLVSGDTLLRVDGDTMRTARDYFNALERFASGHVRVMLGTQMIAKGLDFPNVRLVGVINADTAINLPDFRAAERTFQLVSQVAGRAGRGEHPGRVIVQTVHPQEPAIVHAANHDYISFARGELTVRRSAGLPPIGRMARIVCRDTDLAKARAAAGEIHQALRAAASDLAAGAVRLRGPMPCPIARIAGQHRIAIELLATDRGVIQRTLDAVRLQGLIKSDAHTAVDIDPLALL